MIINVRIDVSEQLLKDLLVTAVEGGSGYWADFLNVKRDTELNIIKCLVVEQERSTEDEPPRRVDVTPELLALGLERLAQANFPSALTHLKNAIDETGDAETADVVLQMTVFGSVVYG